MAPYADSPAVDAVLQQLGSGAVSSLLRSILAHDPKDMIYASAWAEQCEVRVVWRL